MRHVKGDRLTGALAIIMGILGAGVFFSMPWNRILDYASHSAFVDSIMLVFLLAVFMTSVLLLFVMGMRLLFVSRDTRQDNTKGNK